MLIAFFSVLGIVVGASLQYLFTSFLEERKHRRSLQTAAYSDYIRAVAETAKMNLKTDQAKLSAQLADAKTRICLYGSPEVIDKLAQFERHGSVIANDQQFKAFMAVIQAMRGIQSYRLLSSNLYCSPRATKKLIAQQAPKGAPLDLRTITKLP